MNRRGRALTWLTAILAVPMAVAFAPVHPAEPIGWEPQIVLAAASVASPADAPRAARSARQALPPGVCDERGLQVQTILAERAISKRFPEIKEMSGVRPDSMKWHPNGLAIDVMIPDWDTPAGRALGDRIVDFVFQNADRFGLEYVIWQQTYRPASGKPHLMENRGSPDANHLTHVHISSYGGGFPKGGEVYWG
ncbi:MAG: hypothetical protein U0R66_14725 [Mycobacterium sp.]